MSHATNHLGSFVLTEALMPHLREGAIIVFVASAVEGPDRKPAREAKWEGGGSAKPRSDAYATSKQAILAAALAFAREHPRLQIDAIEPGFKTQVEVLGRATPTLSCVLRSGSSCHCLCLC